MDEILTPLTFSEVSRPEAYSRHENKHTRTRCKSHVQSQFAIKMHMSSFELYWRVCGFHVWINQVQEL